MNTIKILILTANPKVPDHAPLRLGAEVRRIEESLQRSKYCNRFTFETQLATRTTDLRRALLEHRPNIVHFSGHGTGEQGLVLENDAGKMKVVRTEAIQGLFAALKEHPVECVLLNACYSEKQAIAIHQFVDCVIGMNQPIGDKAAVEFSEAFYDALGAGSSYVEAFDIGCNAIQLNGRDEHLTPVMLGGRTARTTSPVSQTTPESESPPVQPAALPSPGPSQSFGNISISGSNNPFNVIQAEGDVTIDQSRTYAKTTNPDLQAALAALGELKEAIAATHDMSAIQKKMVAVPVEELETELQKSQPDRTVVDEMIAAVKIALDGVMTLAEPMTKVSTLVAKAWGRL